MLLHRFTHCWITNLTFEKKQYIHERRNRERNIIWYNPPFSKNVKTNIAKQFTTNWIDFSKNNKYHKIFNCNNVRINYSCMDNMTNIISSHNKKITNSDNETNGKTSNCRNKSNCSLDSKCLTNKIVYKAEVETNNGINELSTKVYFGISETEFRSRYNNHSMPFRYQPHENDTELLKYIWSLNDPYTLILNGPFLKYLLDIVLYQNGVIFASWKS